jgi:hypothetical protein
MPDSGTDLASNNRWQHLRNCPGGSTRWVVAWVVLCLQGCVIPPDIESIDATVVRYLKFDKGSIDPSPIQEVIFDFNAEPTRIYSVRNSLQMSGITNNLRYSWYYDLDLQSNLSVNFYAFCGSGDRCALAVCGQKDPDETNHTLLLVVSDGSLIDDTTDPLGFPEGTQFDWVQWHITVKGPCP